MSNQSTAKNTQKTEEFLAPCSQSRVIPIVSELADRFDLKRAFVKGEYEYYGANPIESGAEKDGFILFSGGNAYDRKLNKNYSKAEVLRAAGVTHNDKGGKPFRLQASKKPRATFNWQEATIYPYYDEKGSLLYEVGRIDSPNGKDIRQRRSNGRGGYINNLQNVERVLYRLPEVIAASVVFVVEGEKAADRLNRALSEEGLVGFIATTSPQGACKWQSGMGEALTDKTVYVLPDNDETGRRHAAQVLDDCEDYAARLAEVNLLNLPEKGDVFDWLEGGKFARELIELASNTPEYERPQRFPFITASDILLRPSPVWLIDRVLVDRGTSLITAKHASYKSFFALDIAFCVAIGRDWHGFQVRQGKVLYVAAEGAGGLKARVSAWLEGHEYSQQDVPKELIFLDIPVQVTDIGQQRSFIEEVLKIEPRLIIVDTLARCALGVEENSAAEMGKFVDAIFEIGRATGAHILLVHHNNKAGDYRGSSAVPAAVDTHISLDRKPECLILRIEKQKDGEELQPLCFEKKVVTLPNSRGEQHSLIFQRIEEFSAGKFSASDSERKCYDALLEFGDNGATKSIWKEACEEKGVMRSTFYKALNKLERLKAVEPVDQHKKIGVRYKAVANWLQ